MHIKVTIYVEDRITCASWMKVKRSKIFSEDATVKEINAWIQSEDCMQNIATAIINRI